MTTCVQYCMCTIFAWLGFYCVACSKTYSRVVKFACWADYSTCTFLYVLTLVLVMNDPFTSMFSYVCNWACSKMLGVRQTDRVILTFAETSQSSSFQPILISLVTHKSRIIANYKESQIHVRLWYFDANLIRNQNLRNLANLMQPDRRIVLVNGENCWYTKLLTDGKCFVP